MKKESEPSEYNMSPYKANTFQFPNTDFVFLFLKNREANLPEVICIAGGGGLVVVVVVVVEVVNSK